MRIDPEFKKLIADLQPEEYAGLETSILEDGCRDALIVWQEEDILVDGHNRYEICTRHNLPFDIIEKSFPSRYHAMLWIYTNQLARRNLTDSQRTYLVGARYKLEKKAPHRPEKGGHNDHLKPEKTSEHIAQETGQSEKSVRRAEKYNEAIEAIAEHSEELKDSILSEALKLPKKDVIQFAAVIRDEPEVGQAAVDELLAGNAKTFKGAVGYIRKQNRQQEAQALPFGEYNVVYADPPWQYSNTGLEGSAEQHYQTMPTESICSLLVDIEANIAKNAVLFLWVTNPLLIDGLQVVKKWGFKYKTNIVWVKPFKNYGKSGWYVKGHHELLLIATKGSCLPQSNPQSVIELPKGEHSEKPHQFRELIELMYPGHNYLELFARNQPPRDNWQFWGNEA